MLSGAGIAGDDVSSGGDERSKYQFLERTNTCHRFPRETLAPPECYLLHPECFICSVLPS